MHDGHTSKQDKKGDRRQRAIDRMMDQMAELNQQAEKMLRADDNLFSMWMNNTASLAFKHLQNKRKQVMDQIKSAQNSHGIQVTSDEIATHGTDFIPAWMTLAYGKFNSVLYDEGTHIRPKASVSPRIGARRTVDSDDAA